ncbi:DUF4287 domain-containing protein [Pseudotamlana agarivorans]|uniref:DUF4287 domain-containing protein n=1 Tax=Pseudotamlana agarivorans TaxID=481183 RepID=UPI000B2E67C0|nr:DUF4287 domain-containing protein [Tamlana agarivorans]
MSFQAYIDNIKVKTVKTPADFKKLEEKKEFELGHGHAMAIYATFKRINRMTRKTTNR